MLFTSAAFVLLFLPLTAFGFFAIGRIHRGAAAAWLLLASLVFYGWWMPRYTLLLLGSIGLNLGIGRCIARSLDAERTAGEGAARRWMWLGVAANLGLLGYFKYAGFLALNLNAALGTQWNPGRIVLPIGISFYTFTQIAYLVDTRRRHVNEHSAVQYGLFVTYFPHLIAGPVLHHAQMMPQFDAPATYRFQGASFTGGAAVFAIGLCKKVLLADGIAPYADAVFGPVDSGALPDPLEAWLGTMAYTFQLYFDFSGYSDMAVGLSRMFNVQLPFNFDSPYRSTNIADFWRRWHITLSTFLRDYLYIALGGNRHGPARRHLNLAVTMLLGGLWHGASWSFVIWGGLHGAYLMAHHAFRAAVPVRARRWLDRSRPYSLGCWLLTMLAVAVAWVFFRATSLPGALRMLTAMRLATANDATHPLLWNAGLKPAIGAAWCAALGLLAFLAPNSNRIGNALLSLVRERPLVRQFVAGAALCAVLLLVLLNAARDSVSAFIYFNF